MSSVYMALVNQRLNKNLNIKHSINIWTPDDATPSKGGADSSSESSGGAASSESSGGADNSESSG